MSEVIEPFPLRWPAGRPRTQNRKRSAFRSLSLGRARDDLKAELALFNATNVVMTTSMPTKRDGDFYANARSPDDPGIAVYFAHPTAGLTCLPSDHYTLLVENVRALVHVVNSLRKIERHGGAHLMATSLSGFKALPPPTASTEWRSVFGPKCRTLADVEMTRKNLLFAAHPDRGGSREKMAAIEDAYELALRFFSLAAGNGNGNSN